MVQIVFVYPNVYNLGIDYLLSVCEVAGFSTDLIFYKSSNSYLGTGFNNVDYDIVVDRIIKKNPKVVAFSCVTDTYRAQLRIAQFLKLRRPEIFNDFREVFMSQHFRRKYWRRMQWTQSPLGRQNFHLLNF